MMKRTLLRWNLGLGDALLCNGLVRTLVDRGHEITLPCYRHNLASVEAMFADLPNVIVDDHGDMLLKDDYFERLNLGHYAVQYGTDTFDESRFDAEFYRQAGVPFLDKWEKFSVPNLPDIRLHGWSHLDEHEKIIIHDDAERGFRIPMEGYRLPRTSNLFDHYQLMMLAHEIHCINSCVAIWADMICDYPDTKLVLHRYARPDGGALPIFGRTWTVYHEPPSLDVAIPTAWV